jgi:hypothetical protein
MNLGGNIGCIMSVEMSEIRLITAQATKQVSLLFAEENPLFVAL